MWILLLQRYWSQLLLLALLLLSLFYSMFINSELNSTIVERNQYKQALDYQNASLLAQKQSYDKKLAELPKEIETIKTKYKIIYKNIETWREDENATELENVDNFLNSIKY